DATLVAKAAAAVQEQGFRRAADTEPIGHGVVRVFENREGHLVLLRMLRDALGRVGAIGVDADELRALAGIFLVQLRQAWQIGIVDRTLRAEEDDHDRLLVLAVVESESSLIARIAKSEGWDLLAEIGGRLIGGGGTNAPK